LVNPGDLIKKYPTKTNEGAMSLSGVGSSQLVNGDTLPKYSYAWQVVPESPITNNHTLQPSFVPSVFETKVYLTVSNGYCSTIDSALVELEIDQIPAAFSPNDDQVNDTWQIDNLYLYPNAKLTVYNKWGNPVFESQGYPKDKENMWNGRYNGEEVPAAVYYYVLDFGGERGKAPRKGSVTIVR
jgi:gliding motility-associated-like protein